MTTSRFIINTDGASRSNPGHAAAAYIVQDHERNVIAKEGVYLGIASNNQAEYRAVELALKRLIKEATNTLPVVVELRADSLLIVNQLSGIYKVKNPELKVIYDEIKNLEAKVGEVSYVYIPREENSLTDKLANQALDQHLK